ncbi:MAG TPA: shikimate kinase [Polyangia bacterium]|nr:shikimate kinase [Polyangia bacterium]
MPIFEPDAPLFLVGFMATGKTTVGRLLAARLRWDFEDLDEMITREAGRPVADLFAAEGEDGFRAREAAALGRACLARRTIVATGGGAVVRPGNLEAMLNAGRVVALTATPEETVRRARAGRGPARPLLAGDDPLARAKELLGARAALYERAHLQIDTGGRAPADVAERIVAWMATGDAA